MSSNFRDRDIELMNTVLREVNALKRRVNKLTSGQVQGTIDPTLFTVDIESTERFTDFLDQPVRTIDSPTFAGLTVADWLLELLLEFFNGTFVETMDADVTSDGATITLSLQKEGTGNLIMNFSDGQTVLDCTPALTVTLTAGTAAVPVFNYTYILKSAPTVITLSTSGFPTTAHVRVCTAWVQTAALVNAGSGLLMFQQHNEHVKDSNDIGHAVHYGNAIRKRGARYDSGVDGDESGEYYKLGVGTTYFRSTSGIVNQLHEQIFAAFDSEAGDTLHVINWNGDAYHGLTNLFDIVADANGVAIGANKYFNLTFIGVANKTGANQSVMVNLPIGSYNTLDRAWEDVNKFDVFSMPREISIDSSTGFLIARITFKMSATWVVDGTQGVVDLRGESTGTAAGAVNAAITEFSDSNFLVFDNTDPTKGMAFDVGTLITTGNKRTYQAPDTDGVLALIDLAQDWSADQEFQDGIKQKFGSTGDVEVYWDNATSIYKIIASTIHFGSSTQTSFITIWGGGASSAISIDMSKSITAVKQPNIIIQNFNPSVAFRDNSASQNDILIYLDQDFFYFNKEDAGVSVGTNLLKIQLSTGTLTLPTTSETDDIAVVNNYATGAYDNGGAWGAVALPGNPINGMTVVRYNTDQSETRLYVYSNGAWTYNLQT